MKGAAISTGVRYGVPQVFSYRYEFTVGGRADRES